MRDMQHKPDLALIALRQIMRATDANARSLSRGSGLTPSQFMILRLLGRTGDIVPSVIAREVSLTQATVTTLVDKLAARALVERKRDTTDKRRVLVCLTAVGREVLASTPDTLQERFVAGFSRLEEWEQSYIIAALERVTAILGAEELDAAPVLDVGPIDRSRLPADE